MGSRWVSEMAGYVAVTDARELTPDGVSVIAKHFELRGGSTPVPAYAGARSGFWLAPVYNPGASGIARIRGIIMDARYAGADRELVFMGDSKTWGNGADSGKLPEQSYPGVLRRALGAVEGFLTAVPTGEDSRWVSTNMARNSTDIDGLVTVTPGTASATTLTYDVPHTGGAMFIHCAAGGSVSITVDGGTAQTFTVPAGGGFHEITPTVTGDTAHVYVVTSDARIAVRGFRPVYSTPRLKITTIARPSATVATWLPGATPGVGLWDSFRTVAPNPDAIFCQLGANASSVVEGFPALWDAIAGVTNQAVVISPGGLGNATSPEMYLTVWDQADRLGLALIDLRATIGENAEATARGLMHDTVHENKRGYAWEAAAILAWLGLGALLAV